MDPEVNDDGFGGLLGRQDPACNRRPYKRLFSTPEVDYSAVRDAVLGELRKREMTTDEIVKCMSGVHSEYAVRRAVRYARDDGQIFGGHGSKPWQIK